jgi:benzoate/toluate 1,2-dioxygenase beta subunit
MSGLDAAAMRAAERFVIEEARLIDAGRFEAWLELFAEDGFYWVPAAPGQTDPYGQASLLHEDKTVLRMRVRRLAHPRAYSAQPMPRTAHLIGGLVVDPPSGPGWDAEVRSTVHVAEYREPDRRLYAGHCLHRLRRAGESWRIVLKRVDLIDCDGVHGVITVPI